MLNFADAAAAIDEPKTARMEQRTKPSIKAQIQRAVVLDVIEDGGPAVAAKRLAFYAAMGFQPMPEHPVRMFIGIDMVRKAFGSGNG